MRNAAMLLAMLVLMAGCNQSMKCGHDHGGCCGTCGTEGKPAQVDQAEMMKRFEAFSKPGPEHALLAKRAGKWDFVLKTWQAPGAPPSESKGTSEIVSILGGRYVRENVTATMENMPFEGLGLMGFDNIKKKYVATWCDSMGTGMMNMEGTSSADGKVLTFKCAFSCPMTNSTRHTTVIERIADDDHWSFEMYDGTSGAKGMKMMELSYTRKK